MWLIYIRWLSFTKYCQSSWFCRLKFDEILKNKLISYVCIFWFVLIGFMTLIWALDVFT